MRILQLKTNSTTKDHLFLEGRAFLTYVAGKDPSKNLVLRYKEVIDKTEGGHCLYLPEYLIKLPFLIFIFERDLFNFKDDSTNLNRRLRIAFMISEASTEYADRFMCLQKEKTLFVFFKLALLVMNELLLIIFRFFLWIPLFFLLNNKFKNSI